MKVHFEETAWDDFVAWHFADPAMVKKILELIQDTRRSPFAGLGKPEPLKGSYAGHGSRRIDREHRLVYSVAGKRGDNQRLLLIACRDHYQ